MKSYENKRRTSKKNEGRNILIKKNMIKNKKNFNGIKFQELEDPFKVLLENTTDAVYIYK